jgi:phosphoribosylanthranilate isomerase
MIKVKICGVKTEEVLEAALHAGADYIGFMFYPQSKRYISLNQAARLRKAIKGRAALVAVVVDGDDALLKEITTAIKPDFIQAHGSESPQRIADIRQNFKLPIIKAIGVRDRGDIEKAQTYKAADRILFDNEKGGSGKNFDWGLLSKVPNPKNWLLAGGLNQANLEAAVRASGATSVDISSGVEDSNGSKTPQRVREFLTKAKTL